MKSYVTGYEEIPPTSVMFLIVPNYLQYDVSFGPYPTWAMRSRLEADALCAELQRLKVVGSCTGEFAVEEIEGKRFAISFYWTRD